MERVEGKMEWGINGNSRGENGMGDLWKEHRGKWNGGLMERVQGKMELGINGKNRGENGMSVWRRGLLGECCRGGGGK